MLTYFLGGVLLYNIELLDPCPLLSNTAYIQHDEDKWTEGSHSLGVDRSALVIVKGFLAETR